MEAEGGGIPTKLLQTYTWTGYRYYVGTTVSFTSTVTADEVLIVANLCSASPSGESNGSISAITSSNSSSEVTDIAYQHLYGGEEGHPRDGTRVVKMTNVKSGDSIRLTVNTLTRQTAICVFIIGED